LSLQVASNRIVNLDQKEHLRLVLAKNLQDPDQRQAQTRASELLVLLASQSIG